MSVALSPNFTDNVLRKISQNHTLRLETIKARRLDKRFSLPFSESVVQGLYSGENKERAIDSHLRQNFCYRCVDLSYPQNAVREKDSARDAVLDLFQVSYGLGKEFGEIEGFREDRKVVLLTPEQGKTFVYSMAQGLSLDVEDLDSFSKTIWNQYASGRAPRLGRG